MVIRKSVNALSSAEKAAYVQGVQLLKNSGVYDDFVKMHENIGLNAHRRPGFLPWHREYLLRFERAIQQALGDPNFALPYWDWAADANLPDPTNAPIWQNDFMGGSGTPVSSGPFAFWPIYPSGTLTRELGVGFQSVPGSDTLPNSTEVNDVLAITPYDSSPWDTSPVQSFRNQLEGWQGPNLHNRGHLWVGGSMLPSTSPNDPVFWLHHCNVDRLWAIWQCKYPNEGYQPVNGGPTGHNLNDNMVPWNTGTDLVKPTNVLNINGLGYTYDTLYDSTNGDLLHTIRYSNGGWQPFLGDVEGQSGERGTFINTDCAGTFGSLHVCGVTSDGRLWHTIRYNNSSWQPFFGDIEGQTGNVGSFRKVACAGAGSNLHVCGITADGRIWHTIRFGNGSWQPFFGDIEGQTGESGTFQDVACAAIGNNLHVCAITTTGQILHTIRYGNGYWQNFFGDIEGQTGESGVFRRVACAGVGNVLHVCGVTTQGNILHTLRNNSGGWQPFFGDIEGQTGDSGIFREVACGGVGNQLHVCGVNTDGKILHTIRYNNSSWQPFFGDISGQVCRPGEFQDIACDDVGNSLHVCVIT